MSSSKSSSSSKSTTTTKTYSYDQRTVGTDSSVVVGQNASIYGDVQQIPPEVAFFAGQLLEFAKDAGTEAITAKQQLAEAQGQSAQQTTENANQNFNRMVLVIVVALVVVVFVVTKRK